MINIIKQLFYHMIKKRTILETRQNKIKFIMSSAREVCIIIMVLRLPCQWLSRFATSHETLKLLLACLSMKDTCIIDLPLSSIVFSGVYRGLHWFPLEPPLKILCVFRIQLTSGHAQDTFLLVDAERGVQRISEKY